MSKKLERQAARLIRKAETRALDIRRVVGEYGNSTRSETTNGTSQSDRHREIERAVGKYNEVRKALRRLQKKIQLKSKDTRHPALRA
jgi:hypothetical protein